MSGWNYQRQAGAGPLSFARDRNKVTTWFDVWLPNKDKCDLFGVKKNCTTVIVTP